MFPLYDDNPTDSFPFITIALIAINVLVWVTIQGAGFDATALRDSVCAFGAVPAEITGGFSPLPHGMHVLRCPPGGLRWGTVFTSMFLHGGWLHLLGNMWFLWIFGNNIEDSTGHVRFLLFYLITGTIASIAHIYSSPGSPIPTVGASGAISGVMGAYLLLYPRVRIHTLFIIIIFIRVIPIPAWLVLGEWFAIQVLAGTAAASATAGVAFFAHIGGFVAGVALIKAFENRGRVAAKRSRTRLRPREAEAGW